MYKASAAAAARLKADLNNLAAISAERVQTQNLQAARDAKYEAAQAAAHTAQVAANSSYTGGGLPVGQFENLAPPADPNHHTIYDVTQHHSLIPPPDPNHLSQRQAFSTNDPDMPVVPH
jgi:hypothetical protein